MLHMPLAQACLARYLRTKLGAGLNTSPPNCRKRVSSSDPYTGLVTASLTLFYSYYFSCVHLLNIMQRVPTMRYVGQVPQRNEPRTDNDAAARRLRHVDPTIQKEPRQRVASVPSGQLQRCHPSPKSPERSGPRGARGISCHSVDALR